MDELVSLTAEDRDAFNKVFAEGLKDDILFDNSVICGPIDSDNSEFLLNQCRLVSRFEVLGLLMRMYNESESVKFHRLVDIHIGHLIDYAQQDSQKLSSKLFIELARSCRASMYYKEFSNFSSNEFHIHYLFEQYYSYLYDGEVKTPSNDVNCPRDSSHIPDKWILKDGEYIPVEIKKEGFDATALDQLRRYMWIFNANHGIAVGTNYCGESKSGVYGDIQFISIDELENTDAFVTMLKFGITDQDLLDNSQYFINSISCKHHLYSYYNGLKQVGR